MLNTKELKLAISSPWGFREGLLLSCLCCLFFLKHYFLYGGVFWCALVLLPYLWNLEKGAGNIRYLFPSVLMLIFTFAFRLSTFYYLTFVFSLLLIVEMYWGRTDRLVLFTLLLLSPIVHYITTTISIPLRMELSNWAVLCLQKAGMQAQQEGNRILLWGNVFQVDAGCAGLKMIEYSVLLTIFLIRYNEVKYKVRLGILWLAGILAVALIANLLNNLIRILMLVLFDINAESLWHDAVGLLGLLVYVFIPMAFVVSGLAQFVQSGVVPEVSTSKRTLPIVAALLIIGLIGSGFYLRTEKYAEPPVTSVNSPFINDYKQERLNDGIHKLTANDNLVYIKPISTFFMADHNPAICWTGSGYVFDYFNEQIVAGQKVYVGTLKKDKDQIHTAWWYCNGNGKITVSQLEWRKDLLLAGGSYYLVNVTATSRSLLIDKIKACYTFKIK